MIRFSLHLLASITIELYKGVCFLVGVWMCVNILIEVNVHVNSLSVCMLFQQGAQALFSMEKFKNVSFEEEYTKLFPPQPHQPLV